MLSRPSPAAPNADSTSKPAVYGVRSLVAAVLVAIAALLLGFFLGRHLRRGSEAAHPENTQAGASTAIAPGTGDQEPTQVYAHNIMLRKGPNFRIYLVWISGRMVRTKAGVNPSFDDPDSFILQIDKGVIRANIGDICKYLNSALGANGPLRNIEIRPDGDQIRIRGSVKKVVSLPIEILGTVAPTPDGKVRLHVQHISVLKMPVKGLLGAFDVSLSDLVHSTNMMEGVTLSGNDIVFDTEKLLPPPHIHGLLTAVQVRVPDIEVVYGNAPNDPSRLAQWHNFLRFRNGAINFGRLTMHRADLTMIDAVNEPWFDLDLVNYQNQIESGYTRMTNQSGLEMYMPSLKSHVPTPAGQSVTLEWLKNRNTSLPPDVVKRAKQH